MAIAIETREYVIPAWAACPLMYGDMTGLTDEEFRLVRDFIHREELYCCSYDFGEDEYFSWRNDITTQGATCVDCTVTFIAA